MWEVWCAECGVRRVACGVRSAKCNVHVYVYVYMYVYVCVYVYVQVYTYIYINIYMYAYAHVHAHVHVHVHVRRNRGGPDRARACDTDTHRTPPLQDRTDQTRRKQRGARAHRREGTGQQGQAPRPPSALTACPLLRIRPGLLPHPAVPLAPARTPSVTCERPPASPHRRPSYPHVP